MIKRMLSLVLALCMMLTVLPAGSAAEETEHVHEYVYVQELPATAEAEGMKEHYICSGCEELFVLVEGQYLLVTAAELVIPKLEAQVPAEEPAPAPAEEPAPSEEPVPAEEPDAAVQAEEQPDAEIMAQTPVSYIKADGTRGTCRVYTEINESNPVELLTDGWYVVTGNVSYGYTNKGKGISARGNVHLILTDGCQLSSDATAREIGIRVNANSTLNIYAQSTNINTAGKLITRGVNGYAGIGCGAGETAGNIVINGGNITADAINTNNDKCLASAIGCGRNGTVGDITINGGFVTCQQSGYCSPAIGAGLTGTVGDITINGGSVDAYGDGSGNVAIGAPESGHGGNIIINGGSINAHTSNGAAGIGCGKGGSMGFIEINGGNVTVSNDLGEYMIGSPSNGYVKYISINGGTVSGRAKPSKPTGIGTKSNAPVYVSEFQQIDIQYPEDQFINCLEHSSDEDLSARLRNFHYLYISTPESNKITDSAAANGSNTFMVNGAETSTAKAGDTVSIIPHPNTGYSCKGWAVEDSKGNLLTLSENSFVMPAGGVTVYSSFEEGLAITKQQASEGVIRTLIYGGEADAAIPGQLVTLEAEAADGYAFEAWTVSTLSGAAVAVTRGSFIMPNEPVTVSAAFSGAYPIEINVLTEGGSLYATLDGKRVTEAPAGAVIKLEPEAEEGWQFRDFEAQTQGGETITATDSQSFVMPGDKVIISAAFEPIKYKLNFVAENGFASAASGDEIFISAAKAGDIVAVYFLANNGYFLSGITVTDSEGNSIPMEGWNFEMPMSDVTISMDVRECITYLDKDGNTQYCPGYIEISQNNRVGTLGESGKTSWYYVTGSVNYSGVQMVVKGDVNLILANGCVLTATNPGSGKAAIQVHSGNSLTIYAQSADDDVMGRLYATGGNYSYGTGAGIGGDYYASGCNITINGGYIEATGGNYYAAGIGGGYHGSGSNITINGGTVYAYGKNGGGAGIGGGSEGGAENITINGGYVYAESGPGHQLSGGGAGIGSGYNARARNISINGGTVYAVSASLINGTLGAGAAIGSGSKGAAENIKINGGFVSAECKLPEEGVSTDYLGAAIGAGYSGSVTGLSVAEDLDIYWGADSTTENRLVRAGEDVSSAAITQPGNRYATIVRAIEAKTYKLVTKGNGSTSGSSMQWTINGDISTRVKLTNSFARKGYSFAGWNTRANGSGYKAAADCPFIYLVQYADDNGIINLYAQWSGNSYKVQYNGNGATYGAMADTDFTYGTAGNLRPASFSKTGHQFACWSTKPNGSGVSYSDCARILNLTADEGRVITLYAQWKPNTYSISYNANGGEGTMPVQSVDYTKGAVLNNNKFVRKGYSFAGWNELANGRGKSYAAGENVGNLTAENGKTIELYAQWQVNSYIISYNANGGAGEMPNVSCLYNKNYYLSQLAFTRENYVFMGWSLTAKGKAEFANHEVIRNLSWDNGKTVTLYAVWRPVMYSVVFEPNGASGTMAAITGCTREKAYALTKNAYKYQGYSFTGWNTEAKGSGTAYSNGEKICLPEAADGSVLRLYAQWQPVEYKISYVNILATDTNINPTVYTVEAIGEITEGGYILTAPLRPGFDFNGWYLDKGFKTDISAIAVGTTGNLTLYAKWTAHVYSIEFYGNGEGSGTTKAMEELSCGKVYTLSKNGFKRDYYEFIGWNTEPNGSGTAYSNQQKQANFSTAEGDCIKLYAQWKPVEYKISYVNILATDTNGNPASYTVEAIGGTTEGEYVLANLTRPGFDFNGWYLDKGFKNSVSSIAVGTTGNLTLYASWTAHTYTVSFFPNFETDAAMTGMSAAYGKTFTLSANSFKRPGYSFTGWNTEPNGSGTAYADKQKGGSYVAEDGGELKLYAQWKPVEYKISYVNVLATDTNGNPASYTVKAIGGTTEGEYVLANLTRPGYDFNGWYLDKGFKNSVSSIAVGTTGDITLYAKWTAHTYTVSFFPNFETDAAMTGMSAAYGKTFTLSANSFKRPGYSFTGWNTEPDGSGTAYADKQKGGSYVAEDGGELKLYAQWKLIEYSISYYIKTLEATDITTGIYNVTDTVELFTPSREGYTFLGWYTSAKMTPDTCITQIGPGATGNLKLYAKLDKNYCTIRFLGPDGSETMPSMKLVEGVEAKLSKCTYTCTGFGFTGWEAENPAESGSHWSFSDEATVRYSDFAPVEYGDTIVMTSQWQLLTYYICYNGISNSEHSNKDEYTVLDDDFQLTDGVRRGYKFDGWYSDSKLTKRVTSISTQTAKDIFLYAKWVPNKGTVHFDGNGASSGTMKDMTITSGERFTLPKNSFKRTGYSFTGWYSEDFPEEIVPDGQIFKGPTVDEGMVLVLRANWVENTYTITYTNIEQGDENNNPATFTVNDELSLADPVRPGAEFLGWYTSPRFTASSKITLIPQGTAKNMVLYAKWG